MCIDRNRYTSADWIELGRSFVSSEKRSRLLILYSPLGDRDALCDVDRANRSRIRKRKVVDLERTQAERSPVMVTGQCCCCVQ